MSNILEMPFGFEDLDKVFQISEFLDNKEELLEQFKPEVRKFLVKKGFFTGPFKIAYEKAFDELIVSLIKKELVNHFPKFSPEDILILTDVDFLKMVTDGYLFDQENYAESKNESSLDLN